MVLNKNRASFLYLNQTVRKSKHVTNVTRATINEIVSKVNLYTNKRIFKKKIYELLNNII